MNKIKDVAHKQKNKGTKEIDYQEIVEYLKDPMECCLIR